MNFITDPATKFDFQPADFVPFKDKKVCEYVRSLSGKDLEKREAWWHPEFEVKVMMNPHPVLISQVRIAFVRFPKSLPKKRRMPFIPMFLFPEDSLCT